MDRIEDCIAFIVGKAAQQVARRARDKLEPHGVTPTQYAALKVLSDADANMLCVPNITLEYYQKSFAC